MNRINRIKKCLNEHRVWKLYRKHFLNLVKSNQFWIAITILRSIRHQTELYLVHTNRKSVISIKLCFNLTRFRINFSVCMRGVRPSASGDPLNPSNITAIWYQRNSFPLNSLQHDMVPRSSPYTWPWYPWYHIMVPRRSPYTWYWYPWYLILLGATLYPH